MVLQDLIIEINEAGYFVEEVDGHKKNIVLQLEPGSILPEDDFFSGVRFGRDRLIRGSYAMCDAPLGHIQTQRPSTAGSYDPVICPDCASAQTTPSENATRQIQYGTGVKEVCLGETDELITYIQVISHEIGQYQPIHDVSETEW